jgi:hypothetical protein
LVALRGKTFGLVRTGNLGGLKDLLVRGVSISVCGYKHGENGGRGVSGIGGFVGNYGGYGIH